MVAATKWSVLANKPFSSIKNIIKSQIITAPRPPSTVPSFNFQSLNPDRSTSRQSLPSRPSRSFSHQGNGGFHHQTGGGRAIEIPVPALVVICVVATFWWVTRDYTPMQNEISFAQFVEHMLKKDKVVHIEVINRLFARAVLKELVDVQALNAADAGLPAPNSISAQSADNINRPSNKVLADTFRLLFSLDLASVSSQAVRTILHDNSWYLDTSNEPKPTKSKRSGGSSSKLSNIVTFEVGDINNLELLILKIIKDSHNFRHESAYTEKIRSSASALCSLICNPLDAEVRRSAYQQLSQNWIESSGRPGHMRIPPIFFKEEVNLVQLARSYVPTLLLTAATLITLVQPNEKDTVSRALGNRDVGTHSYSNGTQDRLLKFGKATPLLGKDVPQVKFTDIAGLEQAKKEVSEFVEFLKFPKKFIELGAEIPKGALLIGPPGTGKTLLAKAVAGEAGVPFYSTSGSDFIELFVGVGPSRIRDLFDRARRNAPAIIFIDEIDTIGRSRAGPGIPGNGGSDERESTLNALLVELDGFTTKSGVVILGGTNRGDVLDSALTRPGRFDRSIILAKPSVRERKEIFDIHLRPVKLNPSPPRNEISKRLAALTPGFSGAEIRSVCNEAAIIAARRDAQSVTLMDLENAVERLIGGLKHTGDVLTSELKWHVALHEAGHAVAGWFLSHADPVLKLSIVPRASGSLGYTQILPDELLLSPKEEILTKICVFLGGRVSEHLFADTVTAGAVDDLFKATKLARAFVSQLGFDSKLGLASYAPPNNYSSPIYSEATAQLIDERIKVVLDEQWDRCVELLRSKEVLVKQVAAMLLEKEVISFTDLVQILGPRPGEMKDSVKQYVEALPQQCEADAMQ